MEFPEDLQDYLLGCRSGLLGRANLPVKALDLISEHNARDRKTPREWNLEGIALGTTRYGAEEGEANLGVVVDW